MSRFWSILFFLVPILGTLAFVLAAFGIGPLAGAWLPENYSENGQAIDHLWYLVHYICAFFFMLTGLLIGCVLWKFSGKQVESARYFHSSTSLELVWTIIPAAILIAMAFYQLKTWSAQRVDRPTIQVGGQTVVRPPLVHVTARQFGWTFKYPGADGQFDTVDDISVENLMVVPSDQPIVMQLESRDVIHSFFVPKLRLKHDIIPGMTQHAWFTPIKTGTLSIICAELCGWGHYKMNAELRIVSAAEFARWIGEQQGQIEAPALAATGKGSSQ